MIYRYDALNVNIVYTLCHLRLSSPPSPLPLSPSLSHQPSKESKELLEVLKKTGDVVEVRRLIAAGADVKVKDTVCV
jgi:hypothetical protein